MEGVFSNRPVSLDQKVLALILSPHSAMVSRFSKDKYKILNQILIAGKYKCFKNMNMSPILNEAYLY